MRSLAISRSNRAKVNRTMRISRLMLSLDFKICVMATNLTLTRSKKSTSRPKFGSLRVIRSSFYTRTPKLLYQDTNDQSPLLRGAQALLNKSVKISTSPTDILKCMGSLPSTLLPKAKRYTTSKNAR